MKNYCQYSDTFHVELFGEDKEKQERRWKILTQVKYRHQTTEFKAFLLFCITLCHKCYSLKQSISHIVTDIVQFIKLSFGSDKLSDAVMTDSLQCCSECTDHCEDTMLEPM